MIKPFPFKKYKRKVSDKYVVTGRGWFVGFPSKKEAEKFCLYVQETSRAKVRVENYPRSFK